MLNVRRTAVALVAVCGFALAGAGSASAQEPVEVLVFHGPPDATTEAGVAAIEALGAEGGFEVESTADPAAIEADNLDGYRAVVFLNTAGDHLSTEQEADLDGFVSGGGGFVAIGSTAQGEPESAAFEALVGARPSGESSTDEAEKVVVAGDRVHPATRELPLAFNRSDVWYEWESRPTGDVHTVLRYRAPDAPAGDGTDIGGTDHPISWCRDRERGRTFYMGMGRTAATFGEAHVRTHLQGAIQWSAGLLRANCKAALDSSYTGTRVVAAGPTETGLAYSGESHGLVVAPNGWVVYIGRGDCRTNQERGALVGLDSLPRILDHSNPNVGLGCGSVHVWDPEKHDGDVNSGVTRAGTLAVYGDGGQGGERTNEANHKLEWGLLGIALAPDFMETGHIYLQYFPSFNPASTPPGLGIERRISKISRPRISRFTMDLDTKQLDLSSEVRIFEYDAQVFSCCHVGGGMGFDSEDNLYVTTGDTNSSQGTETYSGNGPAATCPTGPADEASSAHCGANGFSYQDARRTAGNTNDYNGKMLRFRPLEIAEGEQPPVGAGTTYALPNGDSPNGPNLFNGTEGGGDLAKPEIYAMGLRNPSRLSIDPETDIPYTAWVGPDAGAPRVDLGPSTYESAAQIDRAGNYGWPYCMGDKQAYRDRLSDNTPRSTNGPGYVSGGPATGGTDGWYDCNNLVNDSIRNTGLQELPHSTGTGMDAGTMRPNNVWYSRGNPGGNGCPTFPRDRGPQNAPNYGAPNTALCPYAFADGATIMNGPVYRYDEDAEDDSNRWPEYWDGRWFLHNHGGVSIKHGLLLDPATDQDGSQPVWADSLRGSLAWSGNYMDSKFGPDGALYVQVYDGFFRAGANSGLYRYDYTGGESTPFANPTGTPIGNNQVRFSSAGSGGVEFEWDFGDGSPVSTEANPTHTYPAPGEYTAELTVTYADDGTSTKEVTVQVLEAPDETAPVTTASLDPAQPGPGGTYNRAVTVTLDATDQGGTGLQRTDYRVDGGPFRRYTEPFRVSSNGDHTIEFRSTDGAGNEEELKSVSFSIQLEDSCQTDLNDEFSGTTLDDRWEVLRDNEAARSVSGGRLHMLVRDGDMIGGTASAQNLLLQDAPPDEGGWAVTTRVDVSDLTGDGEQTGIVIWESEDPNNFVKVVFIHKPDGQEWFEYVLTTDDGQDRLPNTGAIPNMPDDVFIRVVNNGAGTLTPQYSLDGEEWEPIGSPITELGDELKVGLKVSAGEDSENAAHFDWFRVDCADRAAPSTTAEVVEPGEPDGRLGWYATPPTIELTGDDGPGSGVAVTEYRLGPSGPFQEYDGPFTVDEPGHHVLQYRSVDDVGNEEQVKTLELSVDGEAPETTASLNPANPESGTGPVAVTLGVTESGSGLDRTEYRVDGGAWAVYSAPAAEQSLFDGTQASLDRWAQAPGGSFELRPEDGSMETVGGLGMLWYPGQQFGDFSLKLQYKEARTDSGWSNGGVFTRFPDPRTPLGDRPATYSYTYGGQTYEGQHCSRQGSAATSQAWVAINCGHEIQVNDDPGGGEPQKTGSIYNFRPNNIAAARPGGRGEWTNYEVRVEGQQYTIIREGVVINRFNNAIPRNSSRGGDAPTQARQFASGFIGLQNHGGSDKVRYRNVRVTDLSPGARAGRQPFTVSGRGLHTVEFRSIDWAGNVEDKRSTTFRIGTPPQASPSQPEITPPTFTLDRPARTSLSRLARRGLKVSVTCTGPMQGSAALKVSKAVKRRLKLPSTTLVRRSVRCATAGDKTVTLKPSRKVARKLRKSKRAVATKLQVRLAGAGQPSQRTQRSLTLRR